MRSQVACKEINGLQIGYWVAAPPFCQFLTVSPLLSSTEVKICILKEIERKSWYKTNGKTVGRTKERYHRPKYCSAYYGSKWMVLLDKK